MDSASVVLFFAAFSYAATAVRGAPYVYSDDDHVIITQYGPMRYKPVSAEQLNRPYDGGGYSGGGGGDGGYSGGYSGDGGYSGGYGGGGAVKTSRGHYEAEVIPLDTTNWKPFAQPAIVGGGLWSDRVAGSGASRNDMTSYDVPLGVGYSVRPTVVDFRRRRDHYQKGYRPPMFNGYPQRRFAVQRPPPPRATTFLWMV